MCIFLDLYLHLFDIVVQYVLINIWMLLCRLYVRNQEILSQVIQGWRSTRFKPCFLNSWWELTCPFSSRISTVHDTLGTNKDVEVPNHQIRKQFHQNWLHICLFNHTLIITHVISSTIQRGRENLPIRFYHGSSSTQPSGSLWNFTLVLCASRWGHRGTDDIEDVAVVLIEMEMEMDNITFPETNSSHLKRWHPKRKGSSSNRHFAGANC